MFRSTSFSGLCLAAAAISLTGSVPALAQAGAQSPRSQSAPLQSAYPMHGRNRPGTPPSRVIELPPEPLGPNSLGLLEREFQYMRRTAPQPDKFLYGRWNPRYQVITPAVPQSGVYPYPYGGVYYNYNPYGFVGYGALGYGLNPYTLPNTINRQEVVVIQQRAQELQQQQQQQRQAAPTTSTPPRRDQEQRAVKPSLEGFYRGESGKTETISDALDDIRKAWLNGDFARINARFKPDGKVKIYPRGQYKFTVDAVDFTTMLKDAMTKIDTLSFEFDRPKADAEGPVVVTGTHTFVDADKAKQTTYISYGLERVNGKWFIVEAGSSSTPITRHVE